MTDCISTSTHNRFRLRRYLLLVSVTIIIVTAMLYSFYSSSQMINKYSPLVDATMEIKLEATTAHLWFEEIISGDRYENLDDVIKHIDSAVWYAKAILEGGRNEEGTFINLDDELLRQEVVATLEQLIEFKSITLIRYNAKETSGIGTEIDQQYDQLFKGFVNQIDNVETLLQKKIKADFSQYKIIQIVLIVATILLSFISFVIQYKSDRMLARHVVKITKTKTTAEKNEQWLNTIMDSMGDGVITTDVDGNVTRINPVAESLVGWLQADAQGLPLKRVFSIIDETTRETISNPVEHVINTGETIYLSNHTTLISKDGTEYQIADSAAPIRDSEQNVLGVVLVFNDVTEQYRLREQLNQSLQRLSLHWQDTPLGIIEWSTEFELVDLNPAAEKIFGFCKAEIKGQHAITKILPDNVTDSVKKIWADLLENKGGKFSINENLTKEGRTILCQWYNTPLINSEGAVIGVSSLVIDITERNTLEEKLRLSSKVFSETNEGIMITDNTGIILDVNSAFTTITGYTYDEALGQKPSMLSSGKQTVAFYKEMWQAIKEFGYWQGEVWNRMKNGEIYAELLTISSILDKDKNVLQYVGIFADITQSKKQQARLEQMAHYDALTQLPNRVLLRDRFIQAQAHSKREEKLLAVCFLDLDNFKPVNDNYGHKTGDQLLIEVAERIKIIIRDEDTLSRQGGDEFVLLLGDIESTAQCEQILKRIIKSLSQLYVIAGKPLSISASIGISLFPSDESDFDTLVRHADQAMYGAKQAGRNRYHFFNTEKDQQAIQKHIRLEELKQALANNEFCLYYQPKTIMTTGEVYGVEALIRWNHPENGMIPPLSFLPIIEETELEINIGNWVVNEAVKQLALWNQQGIQLEMSVNISSYHLQSSSFVEGLENILAKYPNVDSTNLQLEILESSALGDLKSISRVIKACTELLGVSIALDDFGTGYSSLTHMKNLSADIIKIDQSFVRDILDDPNDFAIIDGVIGLAGSFNRKIIAEGVETAEHGLMLLAMGCNKAQGYGISRPIPSDEIPEWLNAYTPIHEWISYGKAAHSLKDNKIQIFQLALEQWRKEFESNIHSAFDSPKCWPIMDGNHCFCGNWLKREQGALLFEKDWLDSLDKAHDQFHDITNILFNHYQKNEIDEIRESLKDFDAVFAKMKILLSDMDIKRV